jgi:hypothetical protein
LERGETSSDASTQALAGLEWREGMPPASLSWNDKEKVKKKSVFGFCGE